MLLMPFPPLIRELRLPEVLTDARGIKAAHLRDLGKVVVLAGPNGAGKSRYLQLIYEIATSQQSLATARTVETSRNEANRLRTLAAQTSAPPAREELLLRVAAFEKQADQAQALIDAVDEDTRSLLAVPGHHSAFLRVEPQSVVRRRTELKEREVDQLTPVVGDAGLGSAYIASDAYCTRMASQLYEHMLEHFPELPAPASQYSVVPAIWRPLVAKGHL
jgi:energy-coupling factor transporter ATP-binding protein EcfA2